MIQMSQVGAPLADIVLQDTLPLVDIERLRIYANTESESLLKETLRNFAKAGLNSLILVGGPTGLAEAYLNSLALRLTQREYITDYMRRVVTEKEQTISRVLRRQLYTFDVQRFLSLGDNLTTQCEFMAELAYESYQEGFIWVINSLEDIFISKTPEAQKGPLPPLALEFHRLIRISRITFVATLSWDEYVDHVEHGPIRSLKRYCPFLFLSPPPLDIEVNL